MRALLKYEFRKTWLTKLLLLGITGVGELLFLIGLYLIPGAQIDNDWTSIGILILVLTAFGGVLIIGVESVVVLHRDMNTRQGYMLYMTPRSSFQILGAKMLENGLSLAIAGLFFFLLGFLDVTLLLGKYGQIELMWDYFRQIMDMIKVNVQITPQGVASVVAAILASWLATVSVAYLADIVSSALLNGKKFNGIVTFLLFILLSMALTFLQRRITMSDVTAMLLVETGIAVAYSVLMYVCSAFVMDKYLSV